ncbi:hypothetical protein [Alteribacillus sp. YIM 98480]|uniref:hypothetical protein n=1 Tax=Alteribacillus sp. YIM 98480 TaxID=2606599 RepID=UPI00131C1376|nr:hypothetical protein [Alteribacillus sp. YIM 98480]
MYNLIFGDKTTGEKILTGVTMLLSLVFFIAVPCGIAWIINLLGVSVSYWVAAAIGLLMYMFLFSISLLRLKQFERMTKAMDDEFGKF